MLKKGRTNCYCSKKKTFRSYKSSRKQITEKFRSFSKREDIIRELIKHIPRKSPIISTTGVTSRELFEIREENKNSHESDFLTIGGMGHFSQIATGISLKYNNKKVFCLDGDGSALMHLGAFAINSDQNNLIHILLNNGVHDSVGGQPTKGQELDFSKIAIDLGYKYTYRIKELKI